MREVPTKKLSTLTLSDEELMELHDILLDEDTEAVLRFVKTHLPKKVDADYPKTISEVRMLTKKGGNSQ
jgi:hypothetical protein